MKRFLLAGAALVVLSSPAFAVSHYYSEKISCAAAQQRVREEGAVSFRYHSKRNPSLLLWNLYVTNDNYCEPDYAARQEYLPTADTDKCLMLVCKPQPRDGGPSGGIFVH